MPKELVWLIILGLFIINPTLLVLLTHRLLRFLHPHRLLLTPSSATSDDSFTLTASVSHGGGKEEDLHSASILTASVSHGGGKEEDPHSAPQDPDGLPAIFDPESSKWKETVCRRALPPSASPRVRVFNSPCVMEPSAGTAGGGLSRRFGLPPSASNFIQAPLSALLEYSGFLRPQSPESEGVVPATPAESDGEVTIRIFGAGDQDNGRGSVDSVGGSAEQVGRGSDSTAGEASASPASADGGDASAAGGNGRESSYQRYEIQQIARWIERVLPFSLLLLVVFIRQHLQGFFVTIWIAAVMFKSNDILRKQTALKGERRISVLVGITLIFVLHVVGVYWWYRNDDLLYPLIMHPPTEIPPFWHAVFTIVVNDTMVRLAAMAFKCVLLICYKNSRGRNYRKQGQMLTLVEYLLLLYRALLPAPVWYRFFLNKEYGSLFSSLTTGLYLTFKLTSVVEKVQSFLSALKAFSRKEVHYGSHATTEQVMAAGDLCTICQEKVHAPILLRCKHIFCEDCVSEWFESERTCPLCRALVKPAGLRSFSDGSTSLYFQIF